MVNCKVPHLPKEYQIAILNPNFWKHFLVQQITFFCSQMSPSLYYNWVLQFRVWRNNLKLLYFSLSPACHNPYTKYQFCKAFLNQKWHTSLLTNVKFAILKLYFGVPRLPQYFEIAILKLDSGIPLMVPNVTIHILKPNSCATRATGNQF